jgi:cytochrome b subunit of formate dehydrogenase
MGVVETAASPWGQSVPIHVAFGLIWVSLIAGLLFLVVHAVWLRYFARPAEFAGSPAPANLPAKIRRHTLPARLFHTLQALAMFVLLFTAFLPKVGYKFDWVEYHWMAGLVLSASILFHIVHASFFLDFRAIWPDAIDVEDAFRRWKRFRGQTAPAPRRFAKYPLENKLYHFGIMLCGLAVMITGFFMLFHVRTPFFTRNPYVLGDFNTGMVYLLHGLAGVALIGMIVIHIYFAVRPEKLPITKGMIFGVIDRDHYVHHHDPERWAAEAAD